MTDIDLPTARGLPKQGVWICLWLIGVWRDPRVPSEPRVYLEMAPLQVGCDRSSTATLWLNDAILHDQAAIFSVPLSYLPILYSGLLCVDGKFRHPTPAKEHISTDLPLDISYKTIECVSVNSDMLKTTLPKEQKLISFGKSFSEFGNSQCVLVETPDRTLVFPAFEIIRVYYSQCSTRLKQDIFSGGLENDSRLNQIFNASKTHFQDNGTFSIKLRMQYPDSDSHLLGRLCCSTYAMEQAREVYRALQAAHINARHVHVQQVVSAPPSGFFPFLGRTNLSFHGQPFVNRQGKNMVLVRRVIQCDRPFPFDQIEVVRDNDNTPDGSNRDDLKIGWSGPTTPPFPPEKDEEQIVNFDEPESKISRQVYELSTALFPDLKSKAPKRRKDGPQQFKSLGGNTTEPDVPPRPPRRSTGRGRSGGQDRPVGIVVSVEGDHPEGNDGNENVSVSRPTLEASLANFEDIIDQLKTQHGFDVGWRLADQSNICVPVSEFATGIEPWHRLSSGTPRYIVIAELIKKDQHTYVVELEQMKHEGYAMLLCCLPGLEKVLDEPLRMLVSEYISKKGRSRRREKGKLILDLQIPSSLRLNIINHQFGSVESCAKRLSNGCQ